MPRARQLRQVRGQPREPVGRRGQLDDLQAQRRAAERPAVGAQRAGVAELELLGDVGDHAVVRGRRRAQHRDALGQPLEHLRRCAGSRAGSRGPSRRCSAPRRPPAARRARRTAAASWSRNCGLLSRSGLISSRSTASSASSSRTSSHASRLVELIVCARMPSRSAAAIWLRISASSGETISAGPAPCSRSSAVATK